MNIKHKTAPSNSNIVDYFFVYVHISLYSVHSALSKILFLTQASCIYRISSNRNPGLYYHKYVRPPACIQGPACI